MNRARDERRRLLEAIEAEVDAGRPFALATVIGTEGSTYRHTGARLLVREDGTWTGNISGGCLEGEVVDVAGQVIDGDRAQHLTFDLTADEEAIWGWGLGCNGVIDVLVEPARTATSAVRALRAGERSRRPHVLVTVCGTSEDDLGEHLLVLEDGTTTGGIDGPIAADATAAAVDALVQGGSDRRTLRGRDVLLEVIRPPLHLVVCGAGHDAVPLVQAAADLGWSVTVADDRSRFLDPERFPDADALVRTAPAGLAETIGVDDGTYVVVMTHNFLRDVDYLHSLLGTDVAYIGLLGPGRRMARLLDHLAGGGIEASEADLAKIHGPAGLDLGAEGPGEIAAAICAEVLAVSRGHAGGFLRSRAGRIHEASARP